jgi:iron complex outermembrane receptor protein
VSDVLDWQINDWLKVKSVTSYRAYWGDFSDDQDNSPLGVAWAYNLLDHQQFTEELQFTGKALDNRLNWAAGAFYFDGHSLNRGHVNLNFLAGFFPPGPPFFGQPIFNFDQNDPANTKDKAGFAQGTFGLTEQLHVTAGVRYTKEDKSYTFNHYNPLLAIHNPVLDLRNVVGSTSYSHVDYKGGVDYQVSPDMFTYASVTTGFRGPSIIFRCCRSVPRSSRSMKSASRANGSTITCGRISPPTTATTRIGRSIRKPWTRPVLR